jgi:uncharacterized membrane protein YkgB
VDNRIAVRVGEAGVVDCYKKEQVMELLLGIALKTISNYRQAMVLQADTFITTITIISFMPDGWAASAGGFPAMVGSVAFFMKDVVLLAVSFYLLKQDLVRVLEQDVARTALIVQTAR